MRKLVLKKWKLLIVAGMFLCQSLGTVMVSAGTVTVSDNTTVAVENADVETEETETLEETKELDAEGAQATEGTGNPEKELLKNPVHHCAEDYTEWDYVEFGMYPQSRVTDESVIDAVAAMVNNQQLEIAEGGTDVEIAGKKYRVFVRYDSDIGERVIACFAWEKIKWRVLSIDDNQMFLLADCGLERRSFGNSYDWKDSTIRSWLNDDFLSVAFNATEQNLIRTTTLVDDEGSTDDKIFVLSTEEATSNAYGFCRETGDLLSDSYYPSRYMEQTEYACYYYKIDGSTVVHPDSTSWMLRSKYGGQLAEVWGTGKIYGQCHYGNDNAVVPALYVDTESFDWINTLNQTPKNPIHHCTENEDYGEYSYVYFGSYPQTVVTDEEVIKALNEKYDIDPWYGDRGGLSYGGCFYLYLRDVDSFYKVEPIKWRVLSVEEDKMLLQSDQILEMISYFSTSSDDMTSAPWADSVMRKELNGTFFLNSFTPEEQNAIIETTLNNGTDATTTDKVFLLSTDDAMNVKYGFCSDPYKPSGSRILKNTDKIQDDIGYGKRPDMQFAWWLRTPGYETMSTCVDERGAFREEYTHVSGLGTVGAAPAIYVDIDSPLWSTQKDKVPVVYKYGTITDNCTWTIYDGHLTVDGTGDVRFGWVLDGSYQEEIKTATVNLVGEPDAHGMFSDCINLTSVDLRNFDTSQVTDMSFMFSGCENLVNLDVSGFDTSQVKDMFCMFQSCRSLVNLDVSGFDTSKVTDMGCMFSGCTSLPSIDVSKFDTSQVTDMQGMFQSCGNLKSLDVSGFDTSQVAYMGYMFAGCSGLNSLNVSNFDTSKVKDMHRMFSYCNGLTSLDISNFDMSQVTNVGQVTNFDSMLNRCNNLTQIKMPAKLPTAEGCKVELPVVEGYHWILQESGSQKAYTTVDKGGTYIRVKDDSTGTQNSGFEQIPPGGEQKPGTEQNPGGGTPEIKGTCLKAADLTAVGGTIPADSTFTVTSSDAANPTVSFGGVADEKAKAVDIPDAVIYKGVTYKVTSVSVGSFTSKKDKAKYKVTGNKINNLTVEYKATTDKKKTTVKIPEYTTYKGIKFKVTGVASKAMKGNKKVKTVTIGAEVTKIGNNAFEGCSALKTVTIGKKVKTIGKNAFKNCKKLTKITIKSTRLTKVGSRALKGINAKCKIKVPGSKLSKYKKLFKNKGQKKTVKITK